jgi:hypothetical protein
VSNKIKKPKKGGQGPAWDVKLQIIRLYFKNNNNHNNDDDDDDDVRSSVRNRGCLQIFSSLLVS